MGSPNPSSNRRPDGRPIRPLPAATTNSAFSNARVRSHSQPNPWVNSSSNNNNSGSSSGSRRQNRPPHGVVVQDPFQLNPRLTVQIPTSGSIGRPASLNRGFASYSPQRVLSGGGASVHVSSPLTRRNDSPTRASRRADRAFRRRERQNNSSGSSSDSGSSSGSRTPTPTRSYSASRINESSSSSTVDSAFFPSSTSLQAVKSSPGTFQQTTSPTSSTATRPTPPPAAGVAPSILASAAGQRDRSTSRVRVEGRRPWHPYPSGASTSAAGSPGRGRGASSPASFSPSTLHRETFTVGTAAEGVPSPTTRDVRASGDSPTASPSRLNTWPASTDNRPLTRARASTSGSHAASRSVERGRRRSSRAQLEAASIAAAVANVSGRGGESRAVPVPDIPPTVPERYASPSGLAALATSPSAEAGRSSIHRPVPSQIPKEMADKERNEAAILTDKMQKMETTLDMDEQEAAAERAHFKSILRAFDAYLPFSLSQNSARKKSFYQLPRQQQALLKQIGPRLPLPDHLASEGSQSTLPNLGLGVKARLDEMDDRIRRNADLLSMIVRDAKGFLGGGEEEEEEAEGEADEVDPPTSEGQRTPAEGSDTSSSTLAAQQHTHEAGGHTHSHTGATANTTRRKKKRATEHDLDKVRSTLKQLVRDWSTEGSAERKAAYDPIITALDVHLGLPADNLAQRAQARVLVPGAGLGRLAWEIARQGFSCQGNEFSFFMLVASHFILNNTTKVHEHCIYPYVHSASNWRTAKDMLRGVQIPDVLPSDLPSGVDFSMVAGEFVEVYSKAEEKGEWDAVATCFFIDTARNVVRYLEVLNHLLPIGGLWINLGPLLWHYENNGDMSIELTLEELMDLLPKLGFVVIESRTMPPQTYTGNVKGMLTYDYHPEFWVAKKVKDVEAAPAV